MTEIPELFRAYLIATNRKLDKHFDRVPALVEVLKSHNHELYREYERHLETAEKLRKESRSAEPEEFQIADDRLIQVLEKFLKENS